MTGISISTFIGSILGSNSLVFAIGIIIGIVIGVRSKCYYTSTKDSYSANMETFL